MDDAEYVLSRTLSTVDGEPVRCLALLENDDDDDDRVSLVAGSSGGVVSWFRWSSKDDDVVVEPREGTRPHAATAACALPSGGYSLAGADGGVRVYDRAHALVRTLVGHAKRAGSLSVLRLGGRRSVLVSGSWDGTVRLWDPEDGALLAATPDHGENAVVARGVDGDRLVTATAGVAENGTIVRHTVRAYRVRENDDGASLSCELLGTPADNHAGPVRCVAAPEGGDDDGPVVTCSNDGTVKLRSAVDAECVRTLETLSADPPILLDAAARAVGDAVVVAAAAEDGGLCLWTVRGDGGDARHQRVDHPSCVWRVATTPDGDVVTACQDGNVRVFTRDPARAAPVEERRTFEEACAAARRRTRSGPSAEEISALPRWDARSLQVGSSEGQVKVFQRDGVAIAAQWSDASRTWIEVGEVTGSNPNAGAIDGVAYDHVLPIEVDVPGGGLNKLSIGHNNGDNPFVSAQRFIDEHMLDQNYLGQIADYVRQRVGDAGVSLGGAATTTTTSSSPFSSAAPPAKLRKVYDHIPMKGYVSFEASDAPKMLAKIVQKLRETDDPDDDVDDFAPIEDLRAVLSATSRYHASSVDVASLESLARRIARRPLSALFPALDLARLAASHPDACRRERVDVWRTIVRASLDRCAEAERAIDGSSDKAAAAAPASVLRLLVNALKGGPGSRAAAGEHLDRALRSAAVLVDHPRVPSTKTLRAAVAALFLNAASLLRSDAAAAAAALAVVAPVVRATSSFEPEPARRALVALGTLGHAAGAAARAACPVELPDPGSDEGRAVSEEVRTLWASDAP